MASDNSSRGSVPRRSFLRGLSTITAAAAVPYHFSASRARAASKNSRLQYALIGAGGNGSRTSPVAKEFVDVVAVCDVDANHLNDVNQALTNGKADTYADYRDVLNRSDIDVVQISTPDHWHTKILIEAMLAGKDAYCEKPLTLTIDEGKLIRSVQQKTGRVVQVGTQQRSSFDKFNKAIAIIAAGRIGKLRKITVGIDSAGWSPPLPEAKVPEGLDWDQWLGPSPKVPYRYLLNPKKDPSKGYTNAHTQFRWWYERSGGKLTDWGAHHVDIAMLGIAAAGQSNDPVSVDGTAKHNTEFKNGMPVDTDRYNTAMQFDLHVAFAGNDVDMNIRHDVDNGILFEGEAGRLFVNRGKLVGKPVEELQANPLTDDAVSRIYRSMPMKHNDRQAHWANFLHAIEHRVLPISDVHSHMKMLNVCHLAGICCRLGRKVHWDQTTETIQDDEQAISMMKRPYREGFEIEM
jgi:predicted dehydrogenase